MCVYIPKAVPATLPTIRQPTARPRTRGSNISAIMVCPATMKYVPVRAPSNLIAVNTDKLGARAVPMDAAHSTAMAAL